MFAAALWARRHLKRVGCPRVPACLHFRLSQRSPEPAIPIALVLTGSWCRVRNSDLPQDVFAVVQ